MDDIVNNRNKLNVTLLSLIENEKTVDVPVYGLSMFPFYLPGDKVRVQKLTFKEIRKGDVVLFSLHNKLVLHRLIKINYQDKTIVTKGDALLKNDNVLCFDDVHAVVTKQFRKGKEIKWLNRTFIKKSIALISLLMGVPFWFLGRVWYKFKK